MCVVPGYPDGFIIENSVLALLQYENGDPFCNMALVSLLYGITLTKCVRFMTREYLIGNVAYAVYGAGQLSSRTRTRITEVKDENDNYITPQSSTDLAYVKVSRKLVVFNFHQLILLSVIKP